MGTDGSANIWTDGKTFRDWNERMSRQYDPDLFHNHPNPAIRWLERRRVSWIRTLLGTRSDARTLEVGCGAGNVLAGLPGGQRIGIDLSRFLLSKAKVRLGDGALLGMADAQQLPFRTDCFDRVICSEVIEHVLNPVALLAELARVLKPGGIAVLTIPNEALIAKLRKILVRMGLFRRMVSRGAGGLQAQDTQEELSEWHLHYFDKHTFRPLLLRHFSIRQVKSVPTAAFSLHWVIKCVPFKG